MGSSTRSKLGAVRLGSQPFKPKQKSPPPIPNNRPQEEVVQEREVQWNQRPPSFKASAYHSPRGRKSRPFRRLCCILPCIFCILILFSFGTRSLIGSHDEKRMKSSSIFAEKAFMDEIQEERKKHASYPKENDEKYFSLSGGDLSWKQSTDLFQGRDNDNLDSVAKTFDSKNQRPNILSFSNKELITQDEKENVFPSKVEPLREAEGVDRREPGQNPWEMQNINGEDFPEKRVRWDGPSTNGLRRMDNGGSLPSGGKEKSFDEVSSTFTHEKGESKEETSGKNGLHLEIDSRDELKNEMPPKILTFTGEKKENRQVEKGSEEDTFGKPRRQRSSTIYERKNKIEPSIISNSNDAFKGEKTGDLAETKEVQENLDDVEKDVDGVENSGIERSRSKTGLDQFQKYRIDALQKKDQETVKELELMESEVSDLANEKREEINISKKGIRIKREEVEKNEEDDSEVRGVKIEKFDEGQQSEEVTSIKEELEDNEKEIRDEIGDEKEEFGETDTSSVPKEEEEEGESEGRRKIDNKQMEVEKDPESIDGKESREEFERGSRVISSVLESNVPENKKGHKNRHFRQEESEKSSSRQKEASDLENNDDSVGEEKSLEAEENEDLDNNAFGFKEKSTVRESNDVVKKGKFRRRKYHHEKVEDNGGLLEVDIPEDPWEEEKPTQEVQTQGKLRGKSQVEVEESENYYGGKDRRNGQLQEKDKDDKENLAEVSKNSKARNGDYSSSKKAVDYGEISKSDKQQKRKMKLRGGEERKGKRVDTDIEADDSKEGEISKSDKQQKRKMKFRGGEEREGKRVDTDIEADDSKEGKIENFKSLNKVVEDYGANNEVKFKGNSEENDLPKTKSNIADEMEYSKGGEIQEGIGEKNSSLIQIDDSEEMKELPRRRSRKIRGKTKKQDEDLIEIPETESETVHIGSKTERTGVPKSRRKKYNNDENPGIKVESLENSGSGFEAGNDDNGEFEKEHDPHEEERDKKLLAQKDDSTPSRFEMEKEPGTEKLDKFLKSKQTVNDSEEIDNGEEKKGGGTLNSGIKGNNLELSEDEIPSNEIKGENETESFSKGKGFHLKSDEVTQVIVEEKREKEVEKSEVKSENKTEEALERDSENNLVNSTAEKGNFSQEESGRSGVREENTEEKLAENENLEVFGRKNKTELSEKIGFKAMIKAAERDIKDEDVLVSELKRSKIDNWIEGVEELGAENQGLNIPKRSSKKIREKYEREDSNSRNITEISSVSENGKEPKQISENLQNDPSLLKPENGTSFSDSKLNSGGFLKSLRNNSLGSLISDKTPLKSLNFSESNVGLNSSYGQEIEKLNKSRQITLQMGKNFSEVSTVKFLNLTNQNESSLTGFEPQKGKFEELEEVDLEKEKLLAGKRSPSLSSFNNPEEMVQNSTMGEESVGKAKEPKKNKTEFESHEEKKSSDTEEIKENFSSVTKRALSKNFTIGTNSSLEGSQNLVDNSNVGEKMVDSVNRTISKLNSNLGEERGTILVEKKETLALDIKRNNTLSEREITEISIQGKNLSSGNSDSSERSLKDKLIRGFINNSNDTRNGTSNYRKFRNISAEAFINKTKNDGPFQKKMTKEMKQISPASPLFNSTLREGLLVSESHGNDSTLVLNSTKSLAPTPTETQVFPEKRRRRRSRKSRGTSVSNS